MFAVLTKFLSNPKVQKVILYIVLAIIALWILSTVSEKANRWIRNTFLPPKGDQLNYPVTDVKKEQLEQMAQDIYDGIYGSGFFLPTLFSGALALPDNEFLYMVQYYEQFLSTNKLYYDIDWEIMPTTDTDDQMLARLTAMNLG